MSGHATKLRRVADGEMVDATLHANLELDHFFEAEEAWAPARVRLVRELVRQKVDRSAWPQSLRWNWAAKAVKLSQILVGPFSSLRLFGVRCQDHWQGLLMGECVERTARTVEGSKNLVYVEFVESAPWNWRLDGLDHVPQFRGVGMQLVEMAVRWSQELEFRGRIGLHSLPQSEDFYRRRCGMTDLGPDSKYNGLLYFEMTEEQARAFFEEHTR